MPGIQSKWVRGIFEGFCHIKDCQSQFVIILSGLFVKIIFVKSLKDVKEY